MKAIMHNRPWDKSKLLNILRTKHIYQKKGNLMQILKIDVNRHLPVIQSDNWHSFTGTVFLLLTKYQIRLLWISNRHKYKMFHYLFTKLFYTCLTDRIGNNYILTIQYNICWHMQYLDDVTNFSSSQVIFLQFFPKFSGSLLMAYKKTLVSTDMFPALYFYPKYVMRSWADPRS